MKIVLLLSALLTSASSFAVGDPPQQLNSGEAEKYFIQYEAEAGEIGCSGFSATNGFITGGSLPGFQTQTITLTIAQDKSPEKSTFKITRKTDDALNKTTLSFECQK